MRLSNRLPILDTGEWSTAGPIPDDGYGDCEDYVLLKRRMLIQSGWPREALLVTVVRNERDEGHAVLTVTSDKGDYILDMRTREQEHLALVRDPLSIRETPIASRPQHVGLAQQSAADDRYGHLSLNI